LIYNRQAPHASAAKLFTELFPGAEAQKVFGRQGKYLFHSEVDHKFRQASRRIQTSHAKVVNDFLGENIGI